MRHISILSLLLIALMLNVPVSGQTIAEPQVTFDVVKGYSMKAQVTSNYVWDPSRQYSVQTNLTLDKVPSTLSEIKIRIIIMKLYEGNVSTGNALDSVTNSTLMSLSHSQPAISYNFTVNTPSQVDRFHLNFTIYAQTTGNISTTSDKIFSFRFPQSKTILVSGGGAPLINLYAFPPQTFFAIWLPVYGFVLVMLLVPAAVVAGYKFNERKERRNTNE